MTSKTSDGIGPMISTAMVAAIGTSESLDRGRDFDAWHKLVRQQHRTGGKPIFGGISKLGFIKLRWIGSPSISRRKLCAWCDWLSCKQPKPAANKFWANSLKI